MPVTFPTFPAATDVPLPSGSRQTAEAADDATVDSINDEQGNVQPPRRDSRIIMTPSQFYNKHPNLQIWILVVPTIGVLSFGIFLAVKYHPE